MILTHACELLPGARIRLSRDQTPRKVLSADPYPEDPGYLLVVTDRRDVFLERLRPVWIEGVGA